MKILYKKFLTLVVWLICLGVMSNTVMAQDEVEAYQRSRNEYVFTVQISDRAELQTLTRMASIEKVLGNEVYCFANQKEYDALKKAGYELKLIDNRPTRANTYPMYNGTLANYTFNSYPTYASYTNMMTSFSAYDNCTVLNLGTTPNNHAMYAIRINNGVTEGKPRVLYTGAIHGNEVLGAVSMLKLAKDLLTDSNLQDLVDNLDIFIIPIINPDGTYPGDGKSVDNSTRGNKNGIDLNRNFPDWVQGSHPDDNAYQFETQTLMNFADTYHFDFAVDYHTGGAVVNYPWDCSTTNHADRAWWEYISQNYVTTARNEARSQFGSDKTYMRSADRVGDTPNGYIRGCDWYTVYGGHQDFMNYYKACRTITIEIYQNGEVENNQSGSQSTYLPKNGTSIQKYVACNSQAAADIMREALNGIHGTITDIVTGSPVQDATITIAGHDVNGSAVESQSAGDYHRPIKAGTYNVTYAANGYESQTISVTVADGQTTIQNVALVPDYAHITADFTANMTTIPVGGTVNFTDISTGYDLWHWYWTFEGGNPEHSAAQNPSVTYENEGTYDVTLTVDGPNGLTATLTKEDFITVNHEYHIQNGQLTTCNAVFTDDGGSASNYSDNSFYTYTIYPCAAQHQKIKAEFTAFETEAFYDKLFVYDGVNENATLIGTYYGTEGPGTIIASNVRGALTFVFESDESYNESGWVANITCVDDPTFTVSVAEGIQHGAIAPSLTSAYEGDVVGINVTPDNNYELTGLTYTIAGHEPVNIDLHLLSFVMPADNVTLNATFTMLPTETNVNMQNGSCIAYHVNFYDNGGPNANYSSIRNYTYTFLPSVEGGLVQAVFSSFRTENRYDRLSVYDGENTHARLIGTYSGTANPGTILATNSTGALTFQFSSDNSVVYEGWAAVVTTKTFTQYDINIDEVSGGTIAADYAYALAGTVVTLTATPSDPDHYFMAEWNVTCGDRQIEVIDNQFTMPEGNVTVSGRFAYGVFTPTHYEVVAGYEDLINGEIYVIATMYDGNGYVLGGQESDYISNVITSYRIAVPATAELGNLPVTPGAYEFRLDVSDNGYQFFDLAARGYLYVSRNRRNSSSSWVYGISTNTLSSYRYWNVKFMSDGTQLQNAYYYRDLGYDASNNAFLPFTTSNNKRIHLYRKIEAYWTETEAPAKDILGVNANGEVAAIVYPNPTTGLVSLQAEGMQQISVFDVMGQEVMSLSANSDMETLDLGGLDAGMYIIRICTENGIAVKRVNLMH